MKPEQFGAMLADSRRKADDELLHEIAMSMASFIAAIDTRSIDVAAYIEQRLAPLLPLLWLDVRVREALERIRADGRELAVHELRERRAADLSPEEVEALRWLAGELGENAEAYERSIGKDGFEALVQPQRAAIAALDKIIAAHGDKP